MQPSGDNEGYDLIDLKSEPARLDKHNLPEYFLIQAWTEGRLMNTDVYIHITQIKLLKKYNRYEIVPIILLNEPMSFFEEHGFVTVQKLTAIWEVREIKL